MAIINIKDFFRNDRTTENFTFIFKTPASKDSNGNFKENPVVMPVDATFGETYNLTASITDNEIQDGEVLSDHIHLQPEKITVKCIISEAPIFFISSAVQSLVDLGVSTSFDLLSGETGIRSFARRVSPVLGGVEKYAQEFVSGQISSAILGTTDRKGAQKVFWERFLKKNYLEKKLFKITSGLETVNNVFFETITFDRNYKIGDSLVFDCVLKEVRIVGSDVIITSKGEQAHKSVNRGNQSITEFNTGGTVSSESGTGEVEQAFPKVPFQSKAQLENQIFTSVEEAGNKVLNFVNNLF